MLTPRVRVSRSLETYAPRSGWLDLIESKPNAVTVPDDSWQDDQVRFSALSPSSGNALNSPHVS